MELMLPILSIVIGLYWTVQSFEYGMWVMDGPGGGVFPLIAGVMCIGFGIVMLVRHLKSGARTYDIRALYPVLSVVGIIAATYAIGLIPALGVYVFLWLVAYERYSFLKSLAIGLGTGLVLYLLFDYWLAVPVPMGLFEDMFI